MQKAEVIREVVLKLCCRQTDRHTHRQTDRQTDTQDYKVSEQKQTLPHICVGREMIMCVHFHMFHVICSEVIELFINY